MEHFNWVQLIPGVGHHDVHVVTAAIVAFVLIILSFAGYMALSKSGGEPADKFSIRGFFEVVTEMIVGLVDMIVGSQGRKFVPMFGAIFVYVLINNFVGLLPGMTPATDNLNTTLAIGLFSFFVYNYYGVKEHGIKNYMSHFCGPFLALAPLLFLIELISHMVRPMSLGLRLMGNMVGDHTVLGIFLDISPSWLPVPVVFYGLGVLVCSIQAFVFTLLSIVYVSMAISHDH